MNEKWLDFRVSWFSNLDKKYIYFYKKIWFVNCIEKLNFGCDDEDKDRK